MPEPRTTSFGVSVDPQTGQRYRVSITLRPPTQRTNSLRDTSTDGT